MLRVEVSKTSPESVRQETLSDLSRNASVISSSSSSSSTGSLVVHTPRSRPMRTFSSPRSRSRDGPPTPRAAMPPVYLARELGFSNGDRSDSFSDLKKRAQSRSKSRTKSRNSSASVRVQASDFEFGEVLGEGSYSTVVHAIYPPTEQEYAIKVLDKAHLFRKEKLAVAHAEKNALVKLGSGHPGIVRLHWAFHDEHSLYFVLDLARNGELRSQIQRLGSLSLPCAKFYTAQIVDAVAYMHSKDVIHRDLKPENLLLDDQMRIKITDFGTGKLLDKGVERATTFVGTPQYISPELLVSGYASKSSDLWAVGCIIYQMLAGRFPFHGQTDYLTLQKIKALDYTFPDGFDEEAKDLIQRILVLDPSERLGAGSPGSPNDMQALRRHPFFRDIDWSILWNTAPPPLEAGLVKKEHPSMGEDGYARVAWDQLVSQGEGEYTWTSDDGEFADNTPYPFRYNEYNDYSGGGEEIGPLDVVPGVQPNGAPLAVVDSAELRGRIGLLNGMAQQSTIPLPSKASGSGKLETNGSGPVDIGLRKSVSTGSMTSSSEGSPMERLGAAMEAMALERGRDRAQTPIQPIIAPEAQWANIIHPDEYILFDSEVELRSRTRRLTATLLPIHVPQSKPRMRHLVLTTLRLLCVKVKPGRGVAVKHEIWLRNPTREKDEKEKEKEKKEKDGRAVLVDVSQKGSKAFAVVTSGKSQIYAASDPALVERWLAELRDVLHTASRSQSPTTARSSGE